MANRSRFARLALLFVEEKIGQIFEKRCACWRSLSFGFGGEECPLRSGLLCGVNFRAFGRKRPRSLLDRNVCLVYKKPLSNLTTIFQLT